MLEKLRAGLASSMLSVIIVISICFILSTKIRFDQYDTWKKYDSSYFIKDIPMMSTLDAYSWFKFAREYNESRNDSVPMLSFIIAKLSTFSGNTVYKSAMYIIPFFSSMFIIPFSLYFFQIGYPIAAITGSFIGTFNFMYYTRTSIGRVDTDLLNLFFPFLASFLILLMNDNKKRIYILSAVCGLVMFLFYWWYHRPAFSMIYLFVMIAYLWINKIDKKTILYSSVLYMTIANMQYVKSGLDAVLRAVLTPIVGAEHYQTAAFLLILLVILMVTLLFFYFRKKRMDLKYLAYAGVAILVFANIRFLSHSVGNITKFASFYLSTPKAGLLEFPSVAKTITEAQHVPAFKTLSYVLSKPELSLLGLLLFLVLAVVHWRKILPLAPIIALGLLAFESSQRFVMFLAPFIGAGYGYLLTLLFIALFNKFELSKYAKEIMIYAFSFLFIFVISKQTAISFVPSPSVPVDIYSTFLDFKDKLPENSAVFTWWDFGFALQDVAQVNTFHDGASQENPQTYFIAKGFVSENQQELYDIISFLGNKGNGGIEELIRDNKTYEQIVSKITGYDEPPQNPNTYVLFTRDMIGKYSAMSYLGSWDFEKKASDPTGFSLLNCRSFQNGILDCANARIDLNAGTINNDVPLQKAVYTDNGHFVRETNYGHDRGVFLQLLLKDNKIFEVYVLNHAVFHSNFNQMYLLGRIDTNLYEEVYNVFPTSRLFRVKTREGS